MVMTSIAADAVEQVLEFGDKHLLPHGLLELNIVEFYILDKLIIVFILIIGILVTNAVFIETVDAIREAKF